MSKMKSYLDRLSALSPDQTMLGSDCLVLFLSGSSDITCAGLTAGQLDLLHAICPSGYSVVASNFPFNQDFEHIKSPQVSLLLATTSNVIYYWHTILNFRFQKLLQEHLSPLLEAQEVVLVCKSSGVNMLTQWLRSLGNQVTLPKIARDSAWPGFPASLKSKGTRATGHQRKERSLFTYPGSPLSEYSSGYGSL